MQPLRRHNTRPQRPRSTPWSRRPEFSRSHDIDYESVPKFKAGEVGDVVVEMEDSGPVSPTSTSASARGAAAVDAWMDCATALKDHDEAKMQGWKEELDAHLVFAALFSAILTPFNVESYKFFLTGTQNGDPPHPFNAVLINALWFCSLICSLAAASICLLAKQWLNQYTTGMAGVSPEIARLRQFRYDNLKKWRVEGIMMLVPILLQGALVLFLIGLVEFLLALNAKVSAAAIALISALLAFILFTTLLPTFKPDCSYQSPQAWGVFVVFQALKRPARALAASISAYASQLAIPHADGQLRRFRNRLAQKVVRRLKKFANKPTTYSWKAHERILIDDKDAMLDRHMLVGADATFLDDSFLRNVVEPCLNDMPPAAAVQCYYRIMGHRADRVVGGVYYFDENGSSRAESLAILTDITLDTLEKMRSDNVSIEHPIRTLKTLEPLLVRSLPLTYCHFCRVMLSLLDDRDATVRHLAFSILYQQLSRNLDLAEQHSPEGCHDLGKIVAFISNARTDGDTKHFLDACDLVICLATLPGAESADQITHLRDTLSHLQDFFETPLWKSEPRLLYPISRIAPHLVSLQKRYPHLLPAELVDVLGDVAEQAKGLNRDGNWEDKVIILETTLEELRVLKQASSTQSTLNEELRTQMTRRPSLMRTPLGMLDVDHEVRASV
ncbi:hypothetical protein L226DRAFT_617788 [Lentinus tigrinus ALCF2SS1-7]|uniref:DUF6535 domain-containing protein n=1 Tax=Lentinus tigrinus ALCF2SS1-6 TaxID=1328759 RepID=A0A5C2RQ34_9APHY|nr:hypothetical protein L227DRAFT_658771 [Lentinus tigrinus ALCF2SS1-6]RPD67960.1 hypothetical protein L226DRAFT_617788 [Lentinus tigrinus ALCF2SS1-7]